MFDTLSNKLTQTLKHLTGRGRLTENNIKDTLDQIRLSLIEADVSLPVVESFINTIRQQVIGQTVEQHLRPGEYLIKLVHNELIAIMGKQWVPINLKTQPPAIILLVGLQGSGKTTTAGKLGLRLRTQHRYTVKTVSTDIYRPAAIDQLKSVAQQTGIQYIPSSTDQSPTNIVKKAIQQAKIDQADILIIDTAGRLHIDTDMMDEIRSLHHIAQPIETLLVADSMMGQDATNTAKAFSDALPLTGIILTKADGDARGGAALSIRHITGQPIKFIGTGEKMDALEPFHPDRIVSRILGMGDILTFIEKASQKIDQQKAQKLAQKLRKNKQWNLEDFLIQLQQMRAMGGLKKLMENLPGMIKLPPAMKKVLDDNQFKKMEAMINSMTPKERQFPDTIKNSQKNRITKGSGTKKDDLDKLLKQFKRMQKMMKRFSGGKMKQILSMLQK